MKEETQKTSGLDEKALEDVSGGAIDYNHIFMCNKCNVWLFKTGTAYVCPKCGARK